jgi:hypothetical protein
MEQAQIDRLESTIWVDLSITSKIQVVEAHRAVLAYQEIAAAVYV